MPLASRSQIPPLPERRPVPPRRIRRLYDEFTACGHSLQTVHALSRLPLPPHAAYPPIRRRLTRGPSPLEPGEVPQSALCPGDFLPQFAAIASRPRPSLQTSSRPPLAILDARTLQYAFFNGSKQHTAQMLGLLCPWLRTHGIPFVFLTTERRPPLQIPELRYAAGEWRPELADQATAYFYLDPLTDPEDPIDLPLLLHPDVWKCAVWLDAIIGLHPYAFLPTARDFWRYQLGMEKLACCQDFLCISETSRQEARAIFGSRVHTHITPCRVPIPGDQPPQPPEGVRPGRYLLAIGNELPHKNLAAAVAGMAGAWAELPELDGAMVIGNVTDTQIGDLMQLATALGMPPGTLQVRTRVPHEEFAPLFRHAGVVVVPSFHEGFSLPVVEALLSGIPVCLSDIPAHRELLGETDGFFPPQAPEELARILPEIFRNRDLQAAGQRRQLDLNYHPESTREVLSALCHRAFPHSA